jgi:rhodanese-related sulfurtransferase
MLDHASIFSAELYAIYLALDIIEIDRIDIVDVEGKPVNDFVICSDSQSALQAVQSDDFQNPFLLAVREKLHYLKHIKNKNVSLLWIPSHVGINGNETVDKLAKMGLERPTRKEIKLPHSDLKPLIKPFIHSKWQQVWNEETVKNQKLKEIQPDLDNLTPMCRRSRREELILNRLRIGHTYFTHSFIRKGEPPPQCVSCNCVFTVKHILLECSEYAEFRGDYINEDNMKDLFANTSPDSIINFIRKTGLYLRI